MSWIKRHELILRRLDLNFREHTLLLHWWLLITFMALKAEIFSKVGAAAQDLDHAMYKNNVQADFRSPRISKDELAKNGEGGPLFG